MERRTGEQVHADRKRFIDERHPGGENYRDVIARMGEFLEELTKDPARSVVLISHRAPWYAMEHLLNGVDLVQIVDSIFEWQPGWRYTLSTDPERPT